MPIYEYACDTCEVRFEHVFFEFGHHDDEVACPKCSGKEGVRKLLSLPAYPIFKEKKGTSREDNLEYVMRTNLDNAAVEGRAAREKDPYAYRRLPN